METGKKEEWNRQPFESSIGKRGPCAHPGPVKERAGRTETGPVLNERKEEGNGTPWDQTHRLRIPTPRNREN